MKKKIHPKVAQNWFFLWFGATLEIFCKNCLEWRKKYFALIFEGCGWQVLGPKDLPMVTWHTTSQKSCKTIFCHFKQHLPDKKNGQKNSIFPAITSLSKVSWHKSAYLRPGLGVADWQRTESSVQDFSTIVVQNRFWALGTQLLPSAASPHPAPGRSHDMIVFLYNMIVAVEICRFEEDVRVCWGVTKSPAPSGGCALFDCTSRKKYHTAFGLVVLVVVSKMFVCFCFALNLLFFL